MAFQEVQKRRPVRLTLTRRGVGGSIGWGRLRCSGGADRKLRGTRRIPGIGVYDTEVVKDDTSPPSPSQPEGADETELVTKGSQDQIR